MDSAPGWDRRSRATLRFRDPGLERAYQDGAAASRLEIRLGQSAAIVLWLVGGLLLPVVAHVDPAPVYAIAGAMVAANAVAVVATFAGLATTLDRQQVLGVVLNVLAGFAVLTISVLTSTFEAFAAPAIMLMVIFAFVVLRLQFVVAALTAGLYVGAYVVIGAVAAPRGLAIDALLVGAAVAVACAATYRLEDAQRSIFAQGRLIASLHERVDRLFHQYLSPDVAAALLHEPGRAELGGELAEVSILFADLQGFTPFAERSAPTEVVALLNEYFGAIVPIIFDAGGTVVQFVGDAVMAIFNAPLRQPDHAARASRAALALQAAVSSISSGDTVRPRFRVGVNTGTAVVGNIGGQSLRSFTAIGDAVNLAARLQTYAEAGQVVIGQRTYELVRDEAITRSLGTPSLKGKSDPIAVYELLGWRSNDSSSAP